MAGLHVVSQTIAAVQLLALLNVLCKLLARVNGIKAFMQVASKILFLARQLTRRQTV